MPIYDDTWNPERTLTIYPDYKSHVYVNLRDLTKNHLGKLSLLKFDFVDYKVDGCRSVGPTTNCLLPLRKDANTLLQPIWNS